MGMLIANLLARKGMDKMQSKGGSGGQPAAGQPAAMGPPSPQTPDPNQMVNIQYPPVAIAAPTAGQPNWDWSRDLVGPMKQKSPWE